MPEAPIVTAAVATVATGNRCGLDEGELTAMKLLRILTVLWKPFPLGSS
ncbi:MAG: hypothetical protein VX949_03130 [Planctomycetota bacterium]|nr:hypothetical protein [Planctomycetota bacterium]